MEFRIEKYEYGEDLVVLTKCYIDGNLGSINVEVINVRED